MKERINNLIHLTRFDDPAFMLFQNKYTLMVRSDGTFWLLVFSKELDITPEKATYKTKIKINKAITKILLLLSLSFLFFILSTIHLFQY